MAGRADGGRAASGARMLAPEAAGKRLWPGAIASALTSQNMPLRPRDGAGGAINAASDNYTGRRRAGP